MAGAEEVLSRIERRPGTTYAGLVLNEKGYERAVEAGVDEVRYAFPVTETFAKRNQNTTVEDATGLASRLVERARLDGVRVSITLSRSEEHTSELQSRQYLVCRLLLEKKKIVYCSSTVRHPPPLI